MKFHRWLIRWKPRKLNTIVRLLERSELQPTIVGSIPLKRNCHTIKTDILVIGGGIAGLRAAIAAARYGRVLVVTKDTSTENNTFYAQGGIASSINNPKSTSIHIKDTLNAGQGMCNPRVVEFIIKRGIPLVKELIRWGCRFDKKAGKYDLAQEGAHSQPRILHAGGDNTGKEIMRVFLNQARSLSNINLRDHIFAIDLITRGSRCYGILAYDLRAGELFIINSRQTILATGGAGQIYRETTNPAIATGDGLAMAYRAGCLLEGLEFIQFHPTALYIAGATRALVSEAVRGAGGILRSKTGKRFMPDYHHKAELAPRDIVARSIIHQMNLTNDTNVYLDLTHLAKSYLIKRFPGLYELCRQFNINIARDFIPVRPSAHYLIGGIKVNRRCETNVKHLYAVGEVASSGFHGANRLGSNSLLEGLVLGEMAGITAGQSLPKRSPSFPEITLPRLTKSTFTRRIDITDITNSLKSLMWRDVGVERNGKKLHEVLRQISYWTGYIMNKEFKEAQAWELQNMLTLSYLVTLSAWQRTESRGTHYRVDYPESDRKWRNKYISLHV